MRALRPQYAYFLAHRQSNPVHPLVEVVRVELTSYSAAKKLSTYLVYLFFLKTATRINTLYVSQEAE